MKARDLLSADSRVNEQIQDLKSRYEQAARDIVKGADPDHIARVRQLDPELLKKYVGYAWDRVNSGEYKLNRPNLEEDLRKWFKEKWVRFGPDGRIRGDCARGDDSEGKPKCLPQSKAHSLGKKGRASAAARKRRQDPNPERKGKAINVATKKKTNEASQVNLTTAQSLARDLHDAVLELNELIKSGKRISELGQLQKEILDLYQQLQSMGYDYSPKNRGYIAPLTLDNQPTDKIREDFQPMKLNDYLQQAEALHEKMLAASKQGNLDEFERLKKERADLDAQARQGLVAEQQCPECGGPAFTNLILAEKQDACYHKVRSRYKVWPSAYASGALVQCRKKGAANWGNKSKNESVMEFAQTGGGDSGDYLKALASAWYNDTFNTGSLQRGIKSQEDVERLLARGIVCPDGKVRRYEIGYNGDFDGVDIYSDDYYEHGDESGELDSRTGKPFGPYEFISFSGEDLDEGLAEGIETIYGRKYDVEPNKYYVWAWDGAAVIYGEYDNIKDAQINLPKIEQSAIKRLGSFVKGRFELSTGKELLQRYSKKGVAEGGDDVWGPQGNFAGDVKVNLGGVSMKPISVGNMVKYFGEPAQVVELSKDKKVARITFKNRALTQNVKTSDLTKLGQGVAELPKDDKQPVDESMPASVIKRKQRYAEMTPKEFATAHKDTSNEQLLAMAWRHGYGKGSTHYVDKKRKGQQGVAEGERLIDLDREYGAPAPKSKPRSRSEFSGSSSSYRHPEDTDFMDPIERRLRKEQERIRQAWAADKVNKGVSEDSESVDREFSLVKKLGRLGQRIVQSPKLWEKYSKAINNENIDWIIGLIQDGTGATSAEVNKLANLFGEIGGGLGRIVDFAWAVKEGTWDKDFMDPYRDHRSQGASKVFDNVSVKESKSAILAGICQYQR